MKLIHIQFIFIVAIAMLPGYVSPSEKPESVVIIPQYDLDPSGVRAVYQIQKGRCRISLEMSDMGGFQILNLPSKAKRKIKVDDVTGIAYRTNDSLVFTVSPIYGSPGVYIYDCVLNQKRRIVNPRTIDKAYPDGADYFELQDLRENKIYFYYAPAVDSTDFARFRSMNFLYEVNIDGSGFRKALE